MRPTITRGVSVVKGKQRQQCAGVKRKAEDEEQEEIGKVGENLQWTERGIPNFAKTSAYMKRNMRPGMGKVSLSKSARDKMPSLNDFMNALDPETGKFPLEGMVLTCFDMNFSAEAVKLLVEKVGLSLS